MTPTENLRHELPSVMDLRVLDVLRGFAALYVMIGHAVWLLWVGYHPYLATGGHRALAYASELTRFGHQAVLLFFLLSGFCIHYRQARKRALTRIRAEDTLGGLHVGDFALRRVTTLPSLAARACTHCRV
jgi:peptidoglycan/LPS O-acetylase OafA/YrhL